MYRPLSLLLRCSKFKRYPVIYRSFGGTPSDIKDTLIPKMKEDLVVMRDGTYCHSDFLMFDEG
jgi:hypothetical protein